MKKKSGIKLVLPTKKYRRQFEEYKQKFRDCPVEIPGVGIHGCGSLDQKSVDEWLLECHDFRVGRNLPDGYVPATQFIAVRKADDKLVGMLQIRHSLTSHLARIGGHIGYSVAPDERRKGYGTEMLLLGLEKSKKLGIMKVRVTCINGNIGSAKVIKKCGGVFDGEADYGGIVFERYWINLGKGE